VASLLKDEVMEGQRQLVALAASAAEASDGPRAVTMQEVEARDPTVDIAAQLQQKQCACCPSLVTSSSCIWCAKPLGVLSHADLR